METEELHAVGGRGAWLAADLEADKSWLISLDADQLSDLDHVAKLLVPKVGPNEPPPTGEYGLPHWGDLIQRIKDELDSGLGVVQLRGLPAENYTIDQLSTIYLTVGLHIGIPIPQNNEGRDILVHVRDQGVDLSDPTVSAFQTRNRLPFHSDATDVVGLLCIRPAKIGGKSSVASTIALHDALVAERPDLAWELYQPLHFDSRRPLELGYEEVFYKTPVFSIHKGRFSARYGGTYIRSAQRGRHLGVPELTLAQLEALDAVDSLATSKELRLDIEFQPGDIQLLNNYTILHSRTEYEDDEDPNLRRDLLRLWLTMREPREFAPGFGTHAFSREAAF